MQEDEIYEQLSEIFRDLFPSEEINLTPALSAKDVPGWDSFKQIEIMIAIEERYKVKFRARELDAMQNVGDLAQSLLAKLNAK